MSAAMRACAGSSASTSAHRIDDRSSPQRPRPRHRHRSRVSVVRIARGRPSVTTRSVNEPIEAAESRDEDEDEDEDDARAVSEEEAVRARIEARREAMLNSTKSRQARRGKDGNDGTSVGKMQNDRSSSRVEEEKARVIEALEEEERARLARVISDIPELRVHGKKSRINDQKKLMRSAERDVREQDALEGFNRRNVNKDTELVWVFERRGEGWGEEILPTIKAERRLVEQAPQKALSQGEAILVERFGLSVDDAIAITSAAAAWRVTKKGRALVDKRRLRLAQQNVGLCTSAMIEAGATVQDVVNIIREVPQILSVIPGASAWNTNYIEYVVRSKAEGGGAKGPIRLKAYTGRPRYDRPVENLKPWILEQRQRRVDGELSQEQGYLLDVAGFDKDTYVTVLRRNAKAIWEASFDELVEYQIETGRTNPSEERASAGLGAWLEAQREAYRQGKLSQKRETRLRRIGIAFDATEVINGEQPSAIRDVTVEIVETKALSTSFIEAAMELREYLDEEGEYAEPEIGSPLGVWLMRLRQRSRDDKLSEQDKEVISTLKLDATYIPESWIAMLNMYANLRARRSSYVGIDIDRIRAWQQEQFELIKKNDGSLTEAQIKRLRHAGMIDSISGLAATAINRDRYELDRRREEWAARIAARKAKLENNSVDEEN